MQLVSKISFCPRGAKFGVRTESEGENRIDCKNNGRKASWKQKAKRAKSRRASSRKLRKLNVKGETEMKSWQPKAKVLFSAFKKFPCFSF